MSNRDHFQESDACSGDAAAFMLGALEPGEAESFMEHLEECVVCRDEVDAFRGVVQALPMAALQYEAPKPLRRRIMRAVRQQPKPASVGPPRRLRAIAWPTSRLLTGALAGTVLAVAIAVGVEVNRTQSQVRLIQARVTGVAGRATLRITGNHGELVVRGLPAAPSGHTYEVWLKAPHHPPAPMNVLFSVTSSGNANLGLPKSLAGASELLVTPEPDGGSPAPTHSPVIVAQLT